MIINFYGPQTFLSTDQTFADPNFFGITFPARPSSHPFMELLEVGCLPGTGLDRPTIVESQITSAFHAKYRVLSKYWGQMESLLLQVFASRDIFPLVARFMSRDASLYLFWAFPFTRIECMPWVKEEIQFGRMLALVRRTDSEGISVFPCLNLCDVAHYFHKSPHTVCFVDGLTGGMELILKNGQFYFCHPVATLSERPIGFAALSLF